MLRSLPSFALFALLSAAKPLHGQELVGWEKVYESAEYDYMVSVESLSFGRDESGAATVRFWLGKMLVRFPEEVRAALVQERVAQGGQADGYDAYASTTSLVRVHCGREAYSMGESTDFDARGGVLNERLGDSEWRVPTPGASGEAMREVVTWVCARA